MSTGVIIFSAGVVLMVITIASFIVTAVSGKKERAVLEKKLKQRY